MSGAIAGLGCALGLLLLVWPNLPNRWPSWRHQKAAGLTWADAVDDLSAGVRAGMSLPAALTELGEHGPADLAPLVRQAMAAYRASGSMAIALGELARLADDPSGDRFVAALRIAADVGGADLSSVLRNLSESLRDDLRMRAELQARQGWTMNGARIAAAAPWATVLLLSLRPAAAAAYFSATGLRILAASAALTLVAYAAMVRIARLPGEPRVVVL